jgi:hypothetical protein
LCGEFQNAKIGVGYAFGVIHFIAVLPDHQSFSQRRASLNFSPPIAFGITIPLTSLGRYAATCDFGRRPSPGSTRLLQLRNLGESARIGGFADLLKPFFHQRRAHEKKTPRPAVLTFLRISFRRAGVNYSRPAEAFIKIS